MERRDFMKKTALATAAFGIPTLVPASVFGKNAPSNKFRLLKSAAEELREIMICLVYGNTMWRAS